MKKVDTKSLPFSRFIVSFRKVTINSEHIKNYFSQDGVVLDYARAAINVGLWASEKIVFEKFLKKSDKILELGCGAGRIAHGLYQLGYTDITATDLSPKMIETAKTIAEQFEEKISYSAEDATNLSFDKETFDAAIFGFNGLMQIPLRENRKKAMSEICRVLKKNSFFIFTTHNRESKCNKNYWEVEKRLWNEKRNKKNLHEFGDICYDSGYGELFIHSPLKKDIVDDMTSMGFELVFTEERSNIAPENQLVTDFSDNCVFWCFIKL